MKGKILRACLVAAVIGLGCEGQPGGGLSQEGEVVIDSAAAARRVAAERGLDAHFRETQRPNADGETTRVFVPEPAPMVEVPEGATCGVEDDSGAVLSCVAGTHCLAPSPDEPGVCVAGPRAPVPDGPAPGSVP